MIEVKIATIYPSTVVNLDRFELYQIAPAFVWKTARAIVGGSIEILRLTEPGENPDPRPFTVGWHLAAYVNEDGIALGQAASCKVVTEAGDEHVLFGPVVIVRERVDGEGETHYLDVTEDDIAWIQEHVKLLVQLGGRVVG